MVDCDFYFDASIGDFSNRAPAPKYETEVTKKCQNVLARRF
jgi:hypothetical protein